MKKTNDFQLLHPDVHRQSRLALVWWLASASVLAFIPCVSTWAGAANEEEKQNTVHYSGADSGSTMFDGASCLGSGGKLIMLTAGSETEVGPKFALSLSQSGDSIIEFVPNGKNELTDSFIASSSKGKDLPGLDVTQHKNMWFVTFRNVQLHNPRATAGSAELELNGSISCNP